MVHKKNPTHGKLKTIDYACITQFFGMDRGFVVVAVICVYLAIEILMLDFPLQPKMSAAKPL